MPPVDAVPFMPSAAQSRIAAALHHLQRAFIAEGLHPPTAVVLRDQHQLSQLLSLPLSKFVVTNTLQGVRIADIEIRTETVNRHGLVWRLRAHITGQDNAVNHVRTRLCEEAADHIEQLEAQLLGRLYPAGQAEPDVG